MHYDVQSKALLALIEMDEAAGADETARFLCQELTRRRVLKERAEPRALLPAPAVVTESAAAIAAAVEALKFYGEETNYETPKTGRDRRSAIAKDGGFQAREALATLAEEGE
jgi:hypothetical protein